MTTEVWVDGVVPLVGAGPEPEVREGTITSPPWDGPRPPPEDTGGSDAMDEAALDATEDAALDAELATEEAALEAAVLEAAEEVLEEEEAASQERSKTGAPPSDPTIPKDGLGTVGVASWRVYQ